MYLRIKGTHATGRLHFFSQHQSSNFQLTQTFTKFKLYKLAVDKPHKHSDK